MDPPPSYGPLGLSMQGHGKNSWISGYESQIRQMSDVNYDFYIYVLMMIYGEMVEKRVVLKYQELTDEFCDEVNGTSMNLNLQ
ncbi:hypothetical protein DFH07DRAFT_968832 [Mycena maculata]|uniref:Uncharacterized protein n=1 Tax=Mycena maculata TaxID=230809 RepID=A0AAD7MSY9_9AGAR|nr:hypothetical protein DFH07DRAFT_968832 [Mycena maculata]